MAGFLTAAAAGKVYKIEVDSSRLASTGYNYLRLKSSESVVGAVTGSVIAILKEGRFVGEVSDTVLV